MTKLSDLPAWLRTLALFSVLFLALMGAGSALSLDPVRAQSRAGQFDAHAARERLVRILGDETPHPVDTAAQDAVRERLLQEIAALGFQPDVREAFVCRPQPRGPLVDCGTPRNILFAIGPADAPAVLAVSHYDSVSASPGASDDGLGVSVWLEIARMLSRERLQRRVIFLFSDGEEQALLGAYAFANSPLMDEVESLVDLEARGSRGPAVFFESNQPNADAVAAYSAVSRPVANSVMADVYRLLPNSTDVTALTRPGLDVVNIAVLDGLEDYHTAHDTIASQDLRSVQHMGDSAIAVMRRLTRGPDPDAAAPMAYADIASRAFVYAPVWAVLAALAFSAVVAFFAFWRGGAEARWRTFAAPPLAVSAAGVLAFAADFVIRLARPGEDYAFAFPEPTRAWSILLAFVSVALAAMFTHTARSPQQAGAAGMFWFAALGGLASIIASGISILFALPASAYACGWLISLAWKPAEIAGRWIAGLLVLVVWAPTLFLVELALGWDMPLVFAVLAAVLLLPWLGIIVGAHGEARWRGVSIALGAAAIAAVITSTATPAMSEARPRPLNLSYFLNTTDGEAHMLAGGAQRALPRELREAFEPEFILPGDLVETWAAPAEPEQIPAPVLQNIAVSVGEERVVRGRLAMNGAYRVTIRIPVAASPLRVRVNGVETNFAETGEPIDFTNVACQGRGCEGAEIELVLAAEGATDADWFIIGQTPGLPVAAAEAIRARRPVHTVPIQFGDTAISLTRFRPSG
ncbi:MAG TPA: M28 family peptidase [Candidatus Binatia bacterium]|nr:M28 family peptidase [Candidatus Binatia bacterium]